MRRILHHMNNSNLFTLFSDVYIVHNLLIIFLHSFLVLNDGHLNQKKKKRPLRRLLVLFSRFS